MPNQAPQQSRARFSSHVLTIPKSGMSQVSLSAGQQLEFSFDPSGATFSRSGTDLLISGDNGAGLTLKGFFVAENADALPQFVLPGGDSVPASSYLQSLNIDITTAAGPAPSAPPSSGEGEYSDGAGDLIGGLDRLGSLGTDQWAGSMRTAEIHMDVARRPNAAGDGASGGGNPEIIAFNARAVLYMQHEGDAPGAQPYNTRSVTVQALANNNGTWEASGQNANTITAHPANQLDVDALLVWAEDGNGNVTFRLSAVGKAWMDAHPGQDIAAYYVISDANGKAYTLQVVISADGGFDSSSEHNGYIDRNGLIHGEWHDGKDLSKETDYKTTSSNLSDDLRYTGELAGAEINTGYAADKNWGNDSVTIEGSVRRSSITSGAGDDLITIHGNVNGSTIDTGTGAGDKVDIKGAVFSRSLTDGNLIKAVDGSVTVTAQGANVQAVSASVVGAQNTIIGNTVDITATGTTSAYGIYGKGNASFNTITGTEKVTITATGKTGVGVLADDYSQVDITGKDVSVTGTGQTGNAASGGLRATNNAEIAIHSTGGTVRVDTSGAEAYAMNAAGRGKNLIEGAKTVLLNASHDVMSSTAGTNIIDGAAVDDDEARLNGNIGMWASGRSGTTRSLNQIIDVDRVIIGSDGKTVTGAMCSAGDGTNRIDNAKYVEINATSDGMSANTWGSDASTLPAHNIIQGNGDTDVKMTVTAAAGQAAARGMGTNHTSNAWANRNDILGANEVDITVSGAMKNYAMFSGGGDGNFIEAKGVDITAKGGSGSENYGMFAGLSSSGVPGNANNSIKAERVDILAEGGTTAHGMYAKAGGTNTITASGDATITASGGEAVGVYATGVGAGNVIESKNVDITASSTGSWSQYETGAVGVYATDRSANSVNADGNVNISASGGSSASGVNAWGGGANSITASGDVDISASGGRSNYGMIYTGVNYGVSPQLANTITADGDVRIKASGGFSNTGMSASYFGSNEIAKAASVTVTAEGAGAGLNAAMHADGGMVRGTVGAFNSIHDVAGAVKLIAQGAVGEASLAFRQGSIGMLAVNGAQNFIYNAESLDIQAESPNGGVATYGMKATGGSGDPDHPSLNHVHDIAGTVSITAEGGKAAYGMSASSGANRIESTGDVDITASSSATSAKVYGMYADDAGSNTIDNAGNVNITATGDSGSSNYGMYTGPSGSGVPGNAGNSITAERVEILAEGGNDAHGMFAQYGKNSIDAGGGFVSVTAQGSAGSTFAMDADHDGENSITGGTVNITAKGDTVGVTWQGHRLTNGMNAVFGKNSIDAGGGSVSVTALGESGSTRGIYAAFGGENSITGGTVDITAKGSQSGIHGDVYGILAVKGKNSIDTGGGSVSVTAENPAGTVNAYAMGADGNGARNEIGCGDLAFTAKGHYAGGMHARNADASNAVSASGDVIFTVEATTGIGDGMLAWDGGRNTIDAAGNVTFTSKGEDARGMVAKGAGASNTISASGDVTITSSASSSYYAGGCGMQAWEGGSNTIDNAGNVALTTSAHGNYARAFGMHAENGGSENTIDNAGKVNITASVHGNYARAFGMSAGAGSENTISNVESVNISTGATQDPGASRSSGSYGLSADGAGAKNTITGVTGEDGVRISADTAMYATMGGQNIIGSDRPEEKISKVSLEAGGTGMLAMMSDGVTPAGTNRIQNVDRVEINTFGFSATAMLASNGWNIIEGVNEVSLNAVPETSHGRSYAMMASNGGGNIIRAGENSDGLIFKATGSIYSGTGSSDLGHNWIEGSAHGDNSYEINGRVVGSHDSSFRLGYTNHIIGGDGADRVVINSMGAGEDAPWNYTVSSTEILLGKGENNVTILAGRTSDQTSPSAGMLYSLIKSESAVTVVLKAAHGFAYNAMEGSIIEGGSRAGDLKGDNIRVEGNIYDRSWGYARGNTIKTGDGNDFLFIKGAITDRFELTMGDGYDALVLSASSFSKFLDYYYDWLRALDVSRASIESIQVDDSATELQGILNFLHSLPNLAGADISLYHNLTDAEFSDTAATSHTAADTSYHYDNDTATLNHDMTLGDKDDRLNLGSVENHTLDLGDGHNVLTVAHNATNAHIVAGADDDYVSIGGILKSSTVDMGAGNDILKVGCLAENSHVDMGAGDDHLILNGFTGGTVDGGAGHDILTLNMGGLGGNGAFEAGGAFSGLFTPGAVQNFEELHFDLSGGGDDSLVLDGLIDSLRGLTGGAQTTVRITGDAGSDHVDTQALSAGGWTSTVDPLTGDTRWTHTGSEDEHLIILIQNGLN